MFADIKYNLILLLRSFRETHCAEEDEKLWLFLNQEGNHSVAPSVCPVSSFGNNKWRPERWLLIILVI